MIPILVADDHPIMLSGISAVLRNTRYEIAATASTGSEVLPLVAEVDPQIVVLDVKMPDQSGIDVLRSLRHRQDARPVVLLTANLGDQALLEAVHLGVNGILLKEGAEGQLVACLDHVAAGRKWVDPAIVQRAADLKAEGGQPGKLQRLTDRERQIAGLVAQGRRNRDIADELGITEGTVKVRLHKIYEKIGVGSRTELAIVARDAEGG